MAVNSLFRTLAFAMRNTVTDTYTLLNAVDAVQATVEGLIEQGVEDARRADFERERDARDESNRQAQHILNAAAGTIEEALSEFNASRKIMAIKHVRTAFGVGLKAAKDAVESPEFARAALNAKRATPEPLAEWERELLSGDAEQAANLATRRFSVGDQVTVNGDTADAGHFFEAGTRVNITDIDNDRQPSDLACIRCEYLDGHDFWWVAPQDLSFS